MSAPDPYSPEWSVYWTLKRRLRSLLKSENEYLANSAAEEVVKNLRMSNWHLIKGLPRLPHGGGPEVAQGDEERRLAFEAKVRELESMSASERGPSVHQGKLDV